VKLKRVPPSQIKIPDLRVRARFDQETLSQFKSSISEAGIIAPIIVCQVGEELILVDGEHRLTEAITQKFPTIDVVVFEGDMVDVLTKNLFLDHMRGKTPVTEMVKVIGSLYTDYGLDPDKIKEKTGLTRDYIEKLIKISLASSEIQEALDLEAIGVGVAYELSRLPFAIQQEEVLAKSTVYRLRTQDVKELVDATLVSMQTIKDQPASVPSGKPPPAPVYHCEGCKDEVEPKYLRPVMLCPNCFGHVFQLAKLREPVQEKVEDETETP